MERKKLHVFAFAVICFFNLKFHFQAPNPCHLMLNLNLFVDTGISFVVIPVILLCWCDPQLTMNILCAKICNNSVFFFFFINCRCLPCLNFCKKGFRASGLEHTLLWWLCSHMSSQSFRWVHLGVNCYSTNWNL